MVLFKDRRDAGRKLASKIVRCDFIQEKEKYIVFSLIRGGVPIGHQIAKRLNCLHYPLIIKKIGAPHNPELAIGAMGEQTYYLNQDIIRNISISKEQIKKQIVGTKRRITALRKIYQLKMPKFKNKIVLIADDGIATGATVYTALKLLKGQKAVRIILVSPVAPIDFEGKGFDHVIILKKSTVFSAVSQFYYDFPQLTDEQVKGYFN